MYNRSTLFKFSPPPEKEQFFLWCLWGGGSKTNRTGLLSYIHKLKFSCKYPAAYLRVRSEYTSLNWALRLVTLVTERDLDDNMLILKQVQHQTA